MLSDLLQDLSWDERTHTLHLRLMNAVGHLPQIVEKLAAAGYKPDEVSLRANTLEDVFIQLTGRRLRE
jgi:ABC-2 type transport system ATP-binding protein